MIHAELQSIWSRLAEVTELTYESKTRKDSGWEGIGTGQVKVSMPTTTTMFFEESGSWTTTAGKDFGFSNVYRWTMQSETGTLRLEHLRFGHNQPVYLFDLGLSGTNFWNSIEPHVCSEDLYTAVLRINSVSISLDWSVKGETKDESIAYIYR